MTYFDDDNVTTSVDIGIPDEMWLRAKSFEVGDSVKVRGFLGYWHGCCLLEYARSGLRGLVRDPIIPIYSVWSFHLLILFSHIYLSIPRLIHFSYILTALLRSQETPLSRIHYTD